jgi:ABC-type transport system involved in cytochrome bd biosynthesis fused ATPase/permease subunit
MQCDLNTLSGGELARVILAFTLSLAEIFNSPLLLLDEICASLDEEMTTIVFSSIKEHFKDIPILAISHQCTEGIFDKVIKL